MNFVKILPFVLLFSIFTNTTFSQEDQVEEKLSLDSGSIDNQFEYVIKKSTGWRDERGQTYRVIKSVWLTDLKSHTLDSLQAIQKKLTDTEVIIDSQAKEISELKLNLTNTQTILNNTKSEKDNMSLFGLQMSKTGYNLLMWLIIAVLFTLLIFFIYKFKNSNSITREAKNTLSEMEDAFEEHRKTALEREQKVRRQLLDEVNKQKKKK